MSSVILHDYQEAAVDSINAFFRARLGNPVVVAPTGSGKSIIIAEYVRRAIADWPGTRIMVVAHVKELLEQNFGALCRVGVQGVGLYSAGLRRRDRYNDVIVAGIQSVYDKAEEFGHVDLLINDECHLLNPKQTGMYRDFIAGLKVRNPALKIIGTTATPYRLGHGYIFKGEDAIFTGVSYEIQIEQLINDGYLVRPMAKSGKVHVDLSGVHTRAGEFIEREAAEAFETITFPAVQDVLARTKDRQCGLVFCTGIGHAQSVREAFIRCGETSIDIVTGKTGAADRALLVQQVKAGHLRWLLNVAVFTTGFDAPNIDTIVFLRATQSTGLYVQMIGRGLRLGNPHIREIPGRTERLAAIALSDKPDCLVLDYGENVKRHGPLNALQVRQPGQRRDRERQLAKDCPACEELIPVRARECPLCGHEFPADPRQPNHGTTAAEIELLEDRRPRWVDVQEMNVSRHAPFGKVPSMRVDYDVDGVLPVSEWICFDHDGFAAVRAAGWASRRGVNEALTVDGALAINWPVPKQIKIVKEDSGFWRIKDYRWGEE